MIARLIKPHGGKNEQSDQEKNLAEEAGAEANPEINQPNDLVENPPSGKEENAVPVVVKTPVEEPIVSEFAQNNYWRGTIQYSIKELESDYA